MEVFDVEQAASFLSRDVREVGKLASRGLLPGRKVNGEWRFARAEIAHWLETRLHEYTEEELRALETAHAPETPEPLLANLLSEATTAVPLGAASRSSVLRELVKLAEGSWQVYDPQAVREAIEAREAMGSTALPSGVAIPHPHRPLPSNVLGDSLVCFGRTVRPVPFGGDKGRLCDLFFLVLASCERTHLRVMARLSRLMLRDEVIAQLRSTESPNEAYEILTAAERELLG
jgi:PTS system nitrogen regulatory IIA component